MSNALSSPFNSQNLANTTNQTRGVDLHTNFSTLSNLAPPSWSSTAGPSTWQTSSYPLTNHLAATHESVNKMPRIKKRTPEEQEITEQTRQRFTSRLALDHAAVEYPNVDSPFVDNTDVVDRLLPYHVFQQPKEDLDSITKGKGKATEDDLKQEISETNFALECFKRREALQNRFRQVKIREGKRSSPTDQALLLTQAVLEADRAEMASLNSELRTLRADFERIEKEKRLASNPPRSVFYGTSHASTPSAVQQQYYRPYPYAYTQAYGVPPAQPSSTTTFSVAPAVHTQSNTAIPVQLPVASLPALHALGIIPVPAASIPPDAPQPPAVLRGSTSNGTMLSLEINVSLLQSAQMSGLAMVLNSLMSRSSSANPAGYAPNPTAVPNGGTN